ncbi:hypothetical protein J8I29_01350 [Labrys sp. LIt4]|uniref:hypothetical protein n=1 Tax=Labrys sp. LIt4 TaxID=2821355 RepID=UPI001ADF0B70|nr:hypothetical protein [Labrys sp. LIt4]MBP0577943.1 hypothetical protein [Labrys sp. LIt4]
MTDISQNAQISSDWFSYFFNSTMLSMIVLDLIVALVILIAHRWFVLNERKLNATSITPTTSTTPEKIEAHLPGIAIRPAALA